MNIDFEKRIISRTATIDIIITVIHSGKISIHIVDIPLNPFDRYTEDTDTPIPIPLYIRSIIPRGCPNAESPEKNDTIINTDNEMKVFLKTSYIVLPEYSGNKY